MRAHKTLFESVRNQTGMYFQDATYSAVAGFVLGYDLAYEGGLLIGFREWLIVRLDTGSNAVWPVLVLHAAFPGVAHPERSVASSAAAQRHAVDVLFDLIAEFDEVRARNEGLKDVFVNYQRWIDNNTSA